MTKPEITKLPSGKTITRSFNRSAELSSETHSYNHPGTGKAALLISIRFENGRKVREAYAGRAVVDGVLVPGM
jgi:hypothetical protein